MYRLSSLRITQLQSRKRIKIPRTLGDLFPTVIRMMTPGFAKAFLKPGKAGSLLFNNIKEINIYLLGDSPE